ncbi:MAG: hypothetical protein H6737_27865 [Alphaproteobacteria bacterium]|nr:hypothetical protein [Alphaproteobacteria bacterium]
MSKVVQTSEEAAASLLLLEPTGRSQRLQAAEGSRSSDFGSWMFLRKAHRLGPDAIRALLATGVERENPRSVFAHALVSPDLDDDALVEAWRVAVQALRDLGTTYNWGSKQRKAKLRGVAEAPVLLAATQAACAACEHVPHDMLAVLAIDGSEASEDAFLPHLERARQRGDELLDWLARLRTHATPGTGITRLLDQVDARLEAREAASPALDFAARIGFEGLSSFWVGVTFGSRELSGGVPRFQGHIRVDSRNADWFAVHLSEVPDDRLLRRSSFSATKVFADEHGLGVCTPDELPAWLARAAEALGVEWSDGVHIASSLRGKARDRIRVWLFGSMLPS